MHNNASHNSSSTRSLAATGITTNYVRKTTASEASNIAVK